MATTPIVFGTKEVTLTQRSKRGSGGGIVEWVEVYKGIKSKADEKYDDLVATYGAENVEYDLDHGLVTLRLSTETDEGGDPVTDDWSDATWELVSTDGEYPLNIFPGRAEDIDPAHVFDTADAARAAAIAKVMEEVDKGNRAYAPAAVGGWNGAINFHKLYNRDIKVFRSSLCVLQQSKIVRKGSALALSWAGVDRAWKVAGETGSPNPPLELLGVMTEMKGFDVTRKQWLKMGPTLRQVARNRYQLAHRWQFALRYSNILYAGDWSIDS